MEHELTFKQDKITKNTVRFEEVTENGQPPKVGKLYVQQWALPDDEDFPEEVSLTLEF